MRQNPIAPLLFLLACSFGLPVVHAEPCEQVARDLNRSLTIKIDEVELVKVLLSLKRSDNRRLPDKFVTKRDAKRLGWRPGSDLWKARSLAAKSIGGDVFYNREGKLPGGGRIWREADLDYHGGQRGAKRLVYSADGRRAVTVDHYTTFTTVPPCE
jgi:hypothetical protein